MGSKETEYARMNRFVVMKQDRLESTQPYYDRP